MTNTESNSIEREFLRSQVEELRDLLKETSVLLEERSQSVRKLIDERSDLRLEIMSLRKELDENATASNETLSRVRAERENLLLQIGNLTDDRLKWKALAQAAMSVIGNK